MTIVSLYHCTIASCVPGTPCSTPCPGASGPEARRGSRRSTRLRLRTRGASRFEASGRDAHGQKEARARSPSARGPGDGNDADSVRRVLSIASFNAAVADHNSVGVGQPPSNHAGERCCWNRTARSRCAYTVRHVWRALVEEPPDHERCDTHCQVGTLVLLMVYLSV